MTREEANLKTKEMLSASLKKYMAKKPLGKITVSEIVADCNVNRKTFYYHFEDIYALLRWTLEKETVEVIKQFDLLVDYEDALRFVMDYAEKNAHILNCAFDSVGREQLKRFFHDAFYDVTMNFMLENEKQYGLQAAPEIRKIVCEFIMGGTSALLINSIRNKEQCDRERTVRNVCAIIKAIPEILSHFSEISRHPSDNEV